MTQEEKLDKVLAVLAKKNLEYEKIYDFYFDDEEIKTELPILLGQIVKDGLATHKEINDPEINENYGFKSDVYRITNEGLEFERNSSYKKKSIKDRKKRYWSVVEKVSIAVNAILLLVIAIGSLYISNKANDDKEETKQLRITVDSLTSELNNLRKDTPYQFEKEKMIQHEKNMLSR